MTATLVIIIVTSLFSFYAFNNRRLTEKTIFYPPAVSNGGWYRFFTYGLLHADLTHLVFNMYALFLFGRAIESLFIEVFGSSLGIALYVVLYVMALPASIFTTYSKEKHNASYRSLGASGAVSAIVFSYILIYPMQGLGLMFIPVFIPAFLFGIIYIVVSIYLEKKQNGNINHMAHITGGVFGILFLLIAFKLILDVNIFRYFLENIQVSSAKDLIQFGNGL